MPVEKHLPHLWYILAFFVFATAIFHLITIKAALKKPQNFIRYYMGSTALKLFLYILIILVYRFVDKPTVIPFALGFLAHYFLFTIFEVSALLKQLRGK